MKNRNAIANLTLGEAYTLKQFMEAVCASSPVLLEDLSEVDRKKWYGWINNYRQGKMTIDKQIELAKYFGATISEITIIL